MSKLRVYELAKRYGMKGPEMADVLRKLGFDGIKSHMAVLDEADQMMVSARLEAQGLQAQTAADEGVTATSMPQKKQLPKKKALPPTGKELPRKKALPGAKTPHGATVEAAPEVIEPEPVVEPQPEPVVETPEPVVEPAAPAAEAPPVAEVPATEPEVAPTEPTPVVEAQPEPTAPAAEAASATPEATPAAASAPATPEATPAAASAPATPAPDAPAQPNDQPPGDNAGGDPKKQVKKLLVPQARAQVVRRIQLPEATIRDATRRSAPGGQRNPGGVDGSLRRAALQHTQSRTAQRGGPGQRRGPGAGGRGVGRGRQRDGRGPRKQKTGLSITHTIDPTKVIEIEAPISVKGLSEAIGVKVSQLIAVMTFKLGIKGKNINSFLSEDEIGLVGLELDRNIKIVEQREAEEELDAYLVEQTADLETMMRAPIVTFMGHVDHGKTTLLDKLRSVDTNLTDDEAGGITQHIGAFKVTPADGQSFVVLDTPGHAAFTAMRVRGANITDVVVLVVAADDGVMPQTEEALSHANEAKVPIIVAVNKCDLPGANPDQVRQQLSVKGLQPEEWGGKTAFINVSAKNGDGLTELIERIHLESEIAELDAKPEAPGAGVVIESRQSAERGIVVNCLVMDGTLRLRDQLLCGESHARVRGLTNDRGESISEAGPATPVTVLGLDELPQPGDKFAVVDVKKAKEVIGERSRRARDLSLAERTAITSENLSAAIAEQQVDEKKLIVRADVMGSLEPIRNSLAQQATDEVRFNIVHSGLGSITETDVSLAEASGAMIIGFNTVADGPARLAADRSGVEIRYYDIIYNLLDELKLVLEGLLKPEEIEKITGHAEVRAIFKSSKFGNIAGCYILDGKVNRNSRVRLSRDGKVVYKGTLASLRRVTDDVREVKTGFECGMTLTNYNDIKPDDLLEFYDVEFVKRTLE